MYTLLRKFGCTAGSTSRAGGGNSRAIASLVRLDSLFHGAAIYKPKHSKIPKRLAVNRYTTDYLFHIVRICADRAPLELALSRCRG